jgi:hypothetical protein
MLARLGADSLTIDQRRSSAWRGSVTRRRLTGVMHVLTGPRGADPGFRPLPSALDLAENDYYRFLNHPRD